MGAEYSAPIQPHDPVRDGPWPYETILSYYKITVKRVPELPPRMQQATWDLLVDDASASPFGREHRVFRFEVTSAFWWDSGAADDSSIPRYMVGWADPAAGWIVVSRRTHSDFQAHPAGRGGHPPSLRLPRSALIPACWAAVAREVGGAWPPRAVVVQLGGREDRDDMALVDRLAERHRCGHASMPVCPLSGDAEVAGDWVFEAEGWHLEPIGLKESDRPSPMELLQRGHVGGGLCTVLLEEHDDFSGALPRSIAFYRKPDGKEYLFHLEMLHEADHHGADELADLRRAWRAANPPVARQRVEPSFMGVCANGLSRHA
ncbi:hypothetical protein GGTG_07566 [Gaeumannomyces tritici R3-111a-1]|uniref:Uncharacterized protein n=1 Tax=Gaeumannomyces tritici (strain R3-111a-1) TaxID=644352 RepID=J3P218_GAET3|nr:hypothetical protein GGTG_07566 [Gaeumannomyces tritici R3-111a-1]EJT73710.1 hypothetical protein GGTG_07566 [Gaeumannomyces tritici R3-111a-1]